MRTADIKKWFTAARTRTRAALRPSLFVRFSVKDQTLFAKRLSFLVKAGVPVLESLHILREQMSGRGRRQLFDRLIHDVANGKYLSTALARFRRVFGDFAINLIKVGESSGILAKNLAYLAEELKKKEEMRRKVLSALIYPIFITCATLGVTALLTAFIFPKILPIFASLNVALPITTRILIAVSGFLREWGILLASALVVAVVASVVAHRRFAAFRFFTDRVLLRAPIVGYIMRHYNMANFCRTLGILLKSGVTIVDALAIVGDTTRNAVYAREHRRAAEHVKRGEEVSKHLAKHSRLFPPILTHMIAIGEKTGNLSDTLLYLAELYEGEVEERTKNLSNAIEPILLVVMGLLVGFVAVSVITPIYEITKGLSV